MSRLTPSRTTTCILTAMAVGLMQGCASPGPRRVFPPPPEFPPDHRYALDDLIELSIHHNASLDVARYEAEAAQGLVDQVKALWLPAARLDFVGMVFSDDFNYNSRVLGLVNVDVPVTGNYNMVEALVLTQILATGGKRTSGLKQAKMFAEIKRLEVLVRQDQVVFDVSNYYYLVCLTNEIDKVLDETARRIRVYRQVSENLNRRGSLRASRLDYLQADFFVVQLEQIQIAVRAGRHQAYQALRHYVGIARDEPLMLASVELPPPVTLKDVISASASAARGFLARTETRQVDLFTKIRRQQVEFAKAAWMPNIAMIGTYNDTQGNKSSVLGAIQGLFTSLIVDIPIYDPARRGKLREALGLEKASQAFQRQVEDLIMLQVEVTAIDVQKAVATLFKAVRARQIAGEHYQAARQGYSRELVPASDVVTAIALDMISRLQHLQSLYAFHNAKARLRRVTADREVQYGH